MTNRRLFLQISLIAGIAFALSTLPLFTSHAQLGQGMTSVLVELKDDPGAVRSAKAAQAGTPLTADQLQAYRNSLTAAQTQVLSSLTSRGISFQPAILNIKGADGNIAASVPMQYTLVYNGIVLNVPKISIQSIKDLPEVKAVHPNASLCTNLDTSVPYIRANQVYGSPPRLTQFDNLDTGGLEGEGVYVAVIDTGIDWTHEMFGGDPTPPRLAVAPAVAAVNTNQKVVYSLPMADIVTDGFGHGTHVASTAAGYLGFAPSAGGLSTLGSDTRVHGVAPQAKLMSYKVCSDTLSTEGALGGPLGGCLTSNIVMALEDAVSPVTLTGFAKPVAHVINMSLGGGGGPDDPTSVAADNAVLAGAIVVAAAGNSGPAESTVGSPGAGRRVIAVAANTDPGSNANWSTDVLAQSAVNPTQTGAVTPARGLALASGQRDQIALFPLAGTPPPPADSLAQYYVFVRNGETIDQWPTNVSGRIALVKLTDPRLPETLFAQIANNGALAGAVAVLFVSSTDAGTAVKGTIPAANIMPADGQYLISILPGGASGDPPNGTMSTFPIRINPFLGNSFVGQMAGFSSRGPVQGFGQIKPDISAPGVNILAAMPPASTLGALAGGNYGRISGTSMATPHASGAAALIRQAHPAWSPDVVRTVMINTATNMRSESGTPKADGAAADSIIDQGGGLIDVYHAVHARAIMGVAGDGLSKPSILGSHSFGEVPVVNNRVTSTQKVSVTIQDLSGQGGTYNLSAVNNRDTQINGIGISVSPSRVTVPAGGTASFDAQVTFNGNTIRDPNVTETNGGTTTTRQIEMQWYVIAGRSDGTETLRMPFYFRPVPSLPAPTSTSTETQTLTGTVLAGDGNNKTVAGVTYVDIPFAVSQNTTKIRADLEFAQLVDGTFADLDFFLLDPDGNVITSSTQPGGPEHVEANVNRPGTYTYEVTGFLAASTDFTITSRLDKGNVVSPALSQVAGDFVDASGRHVDFDGSFSLQWHASGGEQGFEIERSSDNQTWQVLADVGANASSFSVSNLPNAQYFFRVRAFYPGQIGLYVSPPGNTIGVLVDQRVKKEITNLVQSAISNPSLSGGVFQLDLSIANQSSNTYVPLVEFKIVSISSASGTVQVINADNGGIGTNVGHAALFDFSRQLGADEQFSAAEVSGTRTMRFRDNASELFSFNAIVTAYQRLGGGSTGSQPPPSGGESDTAGSSTTLDGLTMLLKFVVNPTLKTVTVTKLPL